MVSRSPRRACTGTGSSRMDALYAHTLDPRSGAPVARAPVAVTVIADDAMHADAWATALTVMGADDGLAFAEARGLAARFVARSRRRHPCHARIRRPARRMNANAAPAALVRPRISRQCCDAAWPAVRWRWRCCRCTTMPGGRHRRALRAGSRPRSRWRSMPRAAAGSCGDRDRAVAAATDGRSPATAGRLGQPDRLRAAARRAHRRNARRRGHARAPARSGADRCGDAGASERALFIASTTGEGDPPDPALAFVRDVLARPAALPALQFAVLALGDREYEHFCALRPSARPVAARGGSDAAVRPGRGRQWRCRRAAALAAPPGPARAGAANCRTGRRSPTNLAPVRTAANSIRAAPARRRSTSRSLRRWRAGDLAGRRHRRDRAAQCQCGRRCAARRARARRADDQVRFDGEHRHARRSCCRASHLPAAGDVHGLRRAGAGGYARSRCRIANTRSPRCRRTARLQLLVRRMRRPDGRRGLGSGWLCEHAALGGDDRPAHPQQRQLPSAAARHGR